MENKKIWKCNICEGQGCILTFSSFTPIKCFPTECPMGGKNDKWMLMYESDKKGEAIHANR